MLAAWANSYRFFARFTHRWYPVIGGNKVSAQLNPYINKYDPLRLRIDIAVDTLNEDTGSTRLPISPTEKARLSYYFKEQLTGVHNKFYLHL